jgi:hypothetical protein
MTPDVSSAVSKAITVIVCIILAGTAIALAYFVNG